MNLKAWAESIASKFTSNADTRSAIEQYNTADDGHHRPRDEYAHTESKEKALQIEAQLDFLFQLRNEGLEDDAYYSMLGQITGGVTPPPEEDYDYR
jgi:hypothetical protein